MGSRYTVLRAVERACSAVAGEHHPKRIAAIDTAESSLRFPARCVVLGQPREPDGQEHVPGGEFDRRPGNLLRQI